MVKQNPIIIIFLTEFSILNFIQPIFHPSILTSKSPFLFYPHHYITIIHVIYYTFQLYLHPPSWLTTPLSRPNSPIPNCNNTHSNSITFKDINELCLYNMKKNIEKKIENANLVISAGLSDACARRAHLAADVQPGREIHR